MGACIQTVSDHCFSENLIEETIQEKVIESVGTDKDKARILILAVRASVARNPKCFNIFMNVLEKVLPRVNGPFLKTMKEAVTSEVELPPKLISSDSDTCQLQPTSDPTSDFVHNYGHHNQALKGSEDCDSVTSAVMSVMSEGAATCISDKPKTALESSESSHSQVADTIIISESSDDHTDTLFLNQSFTLHAQGEEAAHVESAILGKMTQASTNSDDGNELSATLAQGEYQVESNQDIEVSCSACAIIVSVDLVDMYQTIIFQTNQGIC